MWMHYLADTLLTKKTFPMSAQQKKALGAFRRRALKSNRMSELVWDDFFKGAWLAGGS
jgi:serine/threonine-protein kinase haspin